MLKKILHSFAGFRQIFTGNKKYLTIFLIIFLLISAIGIVSQALINHYNQNWSEELENLVYDIDSSVKADVETLIKKVNSQSVDIKKQILPLLEEKKIDAIIAVINNKKYVEHSVELLDSKENLIAWTKETAISTEEFFPLRFEPGEIHFYNSDITTFLTIIDTIRSNKDLFYLSVSLPVEKHYKIQNEYYKEISLTKKLSNNFLTEFEIDYSTLAEVTLDGRKHSTRILNNRDKSIAVITFNKPSLDTQINQIKETTYNIQSSLALTGFFILILAFYNRIKNISYRIIRLVVIFLLLASLRYLLFVLNFPSRILEGELTDSSYFASSFGLGIVKSPTEFFISVFLFLIFCIFVYESTSGYIKHRNIQKHHNKASYIVYYSFLLISAFIFLAGFRGFGASIKSVIFDSSLRYFKDPNLLPELPAGLMQLNILLLGLSVVLISVSIILLILHLLPVRKNNKPLFIKIFLAVFIFFQAAGFIYDSTQPEPQGTPIIRILYITFTLVLAYKIYFEDLKNIYNYLYLSLAASIISISLLNFYNTKIEKESLKTTAFELTRPNESWIEFLVSETLSEADNSPEIISALNGRSTNYEAASFIIWSKSLLQRENMSSSVALLNNEKILLGSFGINIPENYRVSPSVIDFNKDEISIFKDFNPADVKGKIISGIIPIKTGEVLHGFVIVTVLYNPEDYGLNNFPPFLASKHNLVNSAVDFNDIKVFDFRDEKLFNVYSDLLPTGQTTEIIFNTQFNDNNEAWLNLKINEEEYISYLLKIKEKNENRILAVLLKEKNLSWGLYNFLKVFFIHSIFILAFLIIVFTYQTYKAKQFKFSFRTQLLVAFLVISLLPLIFLALYNRNLTEEKNQESTLYKLKKRALNIENYINSHYSSKLNYNALFDKASDDLEIKYSIFSGQKLMFSSKDEFYNTGIIPLLLNPEIYDKFGYQGFKELLITENVEEFYFNSFYKKINFADKDYVLNINDVFNKIELPLTGSEVDVFLFGSYSFATILVILLSAIFANRISFPIRRLTKATESVASGDLNFEVDTNQKGEVGELVKGFNYMILQLKKIQAELAEMEREIAWKEMARQVAHEIKNPLTPMKLAVQQLIIAYKDKSNKFDVIFEKVSKTIISQIDTLNNIASEFSSFARMPKLKLEKVDIVHVIEDTANLFLEEKIELTIGKPGKAIIVEADKDQMKRTLINLIRNSIQANATKVKINVILNNSRVYVEIEDNGRGIPVEYVHKVFEPDFTTKEKGMGLGLKMAKKFVEAINGEIIIKETSSSGTTLMLIFPLFNNRLDEQLNN